MSMKIWHLVSRGQLQKAVKMTMRTRGPYFLQIFKSDWLGQSSFMEMPSFAVEIKGEVFVTAIDSHSVAGIQRPETPIGQHDSSDAYSQDLKKLSYKSNLSNSSLLKCLKHVLNIDCALLTQLYLPELQTRSTTLVRPITKLVMLDGDR